MATQLLERVPVDRVRAQADQIHLGRLLLTLLVGLFWVIGWLAGMLSLGLRIVLAAVREGWQDARRPFLEAEVERARRPS